MEARDRVERYRWVILAIVYLSILDFALIFQSIPPILPLLSDEFHLNYGQSGLLVGLFALPGIFISLFGGYLSDRYGTRLLAAACFLAMLGGHLFLIFGKNLLPLLLGRIVIGIGAFILSILLPKILSQWFHQKELGLAMGIFNTGVPLGSIICFALFGRMGHLWGWRIPILFTSLFSLLAGVFFVSLYRPPTSRETEPGKSISIFVSLKELGMPIWWVGLSWLWFNAGFVSFATFAPDFFLRHGYTLEQSTLLIGIPLLGSLFLSAPIGYLIDRIQNQAWFIGLGGFGLACLTLLFNFTPSFLPLVILMGFCSGSIPTSIYSLPPRLLRAENIGLGFGILSMCASVGLFVAPYLVGKIEDLTSGYDLRFVLIPFFFLLVGVSSFFAHRMRR